MSSVIEFQVKTKSKQCWILFHQLCNFHFNFISQYLRPLYIKYKRTILEIIVKYSFLYLINKLMLKLIVINMQNILPDSNIEILLLISF